MTAASPMVLTPLDRKLLRWLETDTDRFERYIAAHPAAGDRIDQLLGFGEILQKAFQNTFAEAVAVPADFADRMALIMQPDRDTGAGSLMMDMFSVGLGTVNLWMSTD
jgi:hypothetical protein